MQRVVVYDLIGGSKEVFKIGNAVESERHERASAEREMCDPRSQVVGYSFQWRDQSAGNGQHSWYE